MTGENIVCFAKDWTEDPTSNNHVMKMLARDNRVLWLNSIATRAPKLSSGSDLSKIGRKLRSFLKGPTEVADHLWIYTPIVLPFPHSSAAKAVNTQILKQSIGLLRRKLGMGPFQLWSFIPTAADYVGTLGESLAVYYCTDEWSQFSSVDSAKIVEMERTLCRKADVVFTTSRTLLEKKKQWNPETYLASHGVDQAHFARALADGTEVPQEIAGLPRPMLGFFGLVEDWIDLDLFAYLAEQRPAWTIVIIGKSKVDTARLEKLPNVKLVGRKPYEELPRWCKAFSVGLMPFKLNELTRNVNPIKMREYLSAGLPVVSTSLPEVTYYQEWCAVADTPAQFLAACDAAIKDDSPARRRARAEAMKQETWEEKVKQLGARVEAAQARKPEKPVQAPG